MRAACAISRVIVALLAAWYVALVVFGLVFPQCSSGTFDETSQAACQIGARNFGPLYQEIVTFSVLALAPLGITFAVLWLVLEAELRKARRS